MKAAGFLVLAAFLLACQPATQVEDQRDGSTAPAPTTTSISAATNPPTRASAGTPTRRTSTPTTPSTSVAAPALTTASTSTAAPTPSPSLEALTAPSPSSVDAANVVDVKVTGQTGTLNFSVTVRSPDTGCEQYADWWEVLSLEGELLYRRVLLHSHIGEQPFTRSGGPVSIASDQQVIVRAHMNTSGYGGIAFSGSQAQGFAPETVPAGFAAGVANQPPLPSGCAF